MGAYLELVDPLMDEISIVDGPAVYLDGMRNIPEHAGLLFATHHAYWEMGNGGFSQFFLNSTGVLAPEAVRGFRLLGMPRSSEIIERAMSHFGRVYPRGRDERNALMKLSMEPSCYMHDPSFDGLDDELWAIIDEEGGGFEAAADRYAERLSESPGDGRTS